MKNDFGVFSALRVHGASDRSSKKILLYKSYRSMGYDHDRAVSLTGPLPKTYVHKESENEKN